MCRPGFRFESMKIWMKTTNKVLVAVHGPELAQFPVNAIGNPKCYCLQG
jgi:hypothetical protein